MTRYLFIILLLSVLVLVPHTLAFATSHDVDTGGGGSDVDTGGGGGDVDTGTGGDRGDPNEVDTVDDVLTVIDRITNWMFTIFLAIAVIMILVAAFKYLTSGGGEEVAKAHKMILYAAVAIAVAILAKGIVNVVESLVKP